MYKGKNNNINTIQKVLSVTISNSLDSGYVETEFEELNNLLNDGWGILSRDIINSNTNSVFTIVYILSKESEIKK